MFLNVMLVLIAFIGFIGVVALFSLNYLLDELIITLLGEQLDERDARLADQPEAPDESEEVTDLLGSEELQIKNALHDEKIEQLKRELVAKQAGVVYDEPHQVVESMYIPKPVHEYAE